MERVHDTAGKRQGQMCGCHGRSAGKQHSESETPPHREDRAGNAALDILDVRFAWGKSTRPSTRKRSSSSHSAPRPSNRMFQAESGRPLRQGARHDQRNIRIGDDADENLIHRE